MATSRFFCLASLWAQCASGAFVELEGTADSPAAIFFGANSAPRAKLSATCENAAPSVAFLWPLDVQDEPSATNLTVEFANVPATCVGVPHTTPCASHHLGVPARFYCVFDGRAGRAMVGPTVAAPHPIRVPGGTELLSVAVRAECAFPDVPTIKRITGIVGVSGVPPVSVNVSIIYSSRVLALDADVAATTRARAETFVLPFSGPPGTEQVRLLALPEDSPPPSPPPPVLPPPSPPPPRPPPFSCTGGVEGNYTLGGVEYAVHRFTSSGTLTVAFSGIIDVLLVGGGGGGASDTGGGGSGGGVIYGERKGIAAGSYAIVVGAGGAPDSALSTSGVGGVGGTTTAFGYRATGGGGASAGEEGNAPTGGANGGGAGGDDCNYRGAAGTAPSTASDLTGGSDTAYGGFKGGDGNYPCPGNASPWPSGGGAGAGQAGFDGRHSNNGHDAPSSNGGEGIQVGPILDGVLNVYWAGGGGGGGDAGRGGDGGRGGGGGGGPRLTGRGGVGDSGNALNDGTNGVPVNTGSHGGAAGANTGGGGGGGAWSRGMGGSGGSGIVVVRYVRS